MTLNELKIGQSGVITAVGGDGPREADEGGPHGGSHRDPGPGL